MKRTRKRPYRMASRVESQAETRQRIIDAAIELHEKLGPAATSLSAIAARAGVQRLTLYRHFPDEAAIFAACTSHWSARHPLPDAAAWASIGKPRARIAAALAAYYDYYAGTAGMWRVAYRDVDRVAPIRPVLDGVAAQLEALAARLAADCGARGKRDPVLVTLRHALAFSTWRELEERGLGTTAKVALVAGWLDGLNRRGRAA